MATLRDLVVRITSDTKGLEAGLDQTAKKMQNLTNKMNKMGQMLTLGLTVPILGAAAAAVKLASDLEETTNKTRVVFGKMSDEMLAWAKTGTKTMGMSTEHALKYASTFGSLLKNMGLTEIETAKYSKTLTQMVADYSSFHNLSPEVAFEKIKAGLVGSSEPLLALGKNLKVSQVEAYALANGLDYTTESGKALATIGLLMSQSNDEAGDYLETSKGLANSTRTLKESFEELGATLGGVLLPYVTALVNKLLEWVTALNEMSPAQQKFVVGVGIFLASIGPVVWFITKLIIVWGWISKVINVIKLLVFAGGGLKVMLLATAATFGTLTVPVWAVIALIGVLIATIILFGKQAAVAADQLLKIIGQLFKNLGAWFASLPEKFFKTGQNIIAGLIGGIQSKVASLMETIKNPMQMVIDIANGTVKTGSPSKVFKQIGENMMLGLEQGISGMASIPVKATMEGIPTSIGAGVSSGRKASIGDIYIYGDMSPAMKENLRNEVRTIFNVEMTGLLSGA